MVGIPGPEDKGSNPFKNVNSYRLMGRSSNAGRMLVRPQQYKLS